MPFIIVHMSERMLEQTDPDLSEAIRRGAVEALELKPDHGHVLLYGTPMHRRGVHEHRNRGFVFVQILLFSGRSGQMKEDLFRTISALIHQHTGIHEKDILINAIETDRSNWASAGGVPMDRQDLGY